MCETWDNFCDWYLDTAEEQIREFRKHIAICEECQDKFLKAKDTIALKAITITDKEVISHFSRGKGISTD